MIYLKSQGDLYDGNPDLLLDKIGQKAIGLLSIPQNWTPPFFVLTTEFFEIWSAEKKDNILFIGSLSLTLTSLNQNLLSLKENGYLKIIARSSATNESLDDRGNFESKECSNDLNSVVSVIDKIFLCANEVIKNKEKDKFAIIIQGYVKPKYSGHLSNERRLARNMNIWSVEYINHISNECESENINILSTKSTLSNELIRSNSKTDLMEKLRQIAYTIFVKKERCHFEWLWDGTIIWLVQKDMEVIEKGTKPGSNWKYKDIVIAKDKLKVLKVDDKCNNQWNKIENVIIFRKLGLPTSTFFVLEDVEAMRLLLNNQKSLRLEEDLKIVAVYPIVIRTSFRKDNEKEFNLYLPRTETVFSWEKAITFISDTIKTLVSQHSLNLEDFSFLIHNFIISKACALVYTLPDNSKVRIDSSWGLADGLAYNRYDSFEIDSKKKKVEKRIRGKSEYLDVDSSGKWIIKKSGSNWDWKESLDDKEAIKISEMSFKISGFLKKPIIVMFFINYEKSKIHPHILPWHIINDIPLFEDNKSENIFGRKLINISNSEDFTFFKLRYGKDYYKGERVTLRLKFDPSFLRNTQFIKDIGIFAKNNDFHIELEGSILSHAFYILSNLGVKLKCSDLFEPNYDKQDFYKLVRDKIPQKIISHGEKTIFSKIPRKTLIELLKVKAVEESLELKNAVSDDEIIEELADIFEVIRGLAGAMNLTMDVIQNFAEKKKNERGGFEEGIYLQETKELSITTLLRAREEKTQIVNAKNLKGEKARLDQRNLVISLIPPINRTQVSALYFKDENIHLVIKYGDKEVIVTFEGDNKNKNPNQLELF